MVPWLAVCIASVLGLELGLVGPMQPQVGSVFVLSLCGMPERKGCDSFIEAAESYTLAKGNV